MKRIRGVAAMLALTGALLMAPRLEAQVQLGWNSSMSTLCLNTACTHVLFTLNLSGLKPTDNNGNPVPAAIHALGSPGYVSFMSIDFVSAGTFTCVPSCPTVTSPGTWSTNIVGGGISIFNTQIATPLSSAPVSVDAWLTSGGGAWTYSGLAYLGANTECYDASGAVVSCPGVYRQGDFNGFTTTIPEPMSMTLLATGLVGLGLVSWRRRRKPAD